MFAGQSISPRSCVSAAATLSAPLGMLLPLCIGHAPYDVCTSRAARRNSMPRRAARSAGPKATSPAWSSRRAFSRPANGHRCCGPAARFLRARAQQPFSLHSTRSRPHPRSPRPSGQSDRLCPQRRRGPVCVGRRRAVSPGVSLPAEGRACVSSAEGRDAGTSTRRPTSSWPSGRCCRACRCTAAVSSSIPARDPAGRTVLGRGWSTGLVCKCGVRVDARVTVCLKCSRCPSSHPDADFL